MYSGYGQWIIKRIGEIPPDSGIAAIIRHSERPDFRDIPVEKWNSTLLTDNGERTAVKFGTALINEAGASSVAAEGWGLERCQLTAEKISEGAKLAGSAGSLYKTLLGLHSPISNYELYRKYLEDDRYFQMVSEWFSTEPYSGPMKAFRPYSMDTISSVVRDHLHSEGGPTIIVTHDLYILPLLNHVFDTQVTEVDFMDGILMARNGNSLDFYSRDAHRTLPVSDFK